MPQSLLGSLPVCHQHFFQAAFLTYILVNSSQKGLESTLFHTLTNIYLRCRWRGTAYVVIRRWPRQIDFIHVKQDRVTGSVKRARTNLGAKAVMSFTQRANTLEVSKHAQPQSPDTTLYTRVQDLHTTHSLTHVVLATWYLNLPPGREWKMCHSCYLLHSHKQRWLTAGWIAPLCSVMQRHWVGGMACCHLFTVLWCVHRGAGWVLKSQCPVTFRSGLESRAQLCGISLPTAGLQCQE